MIDGLVSIITPLYNAKDYLLETVKSIKNQTYKNWEWYITDDCSTDGSYELALELTKGDDRIHVQKLPLNSGTAKARNAGLRKAKGQYISFIDADDLWNNDFLEKQIKYLKENNAAFVSSSYLMKSIDYECVYEVPDKVTYKDLLKQNTISCLSLVYDAKQCGVELFREDMRKREDYICWLQILKRIPYVVGNKECLATYRILPTSKSRNKRKLIKYQWMVFRKVEKLNWFKSMYYLWLWAIHGLKKYRKFK